MRQIVLWPLALGLVAAALAQPAKKEDPPARDGKDKAPVVYVTQPQEAILYLFRGDSKLVWLVSLTSDECLFKNRKTDLNPLKYKVADGYIKGIELRSGERYAPSGVTRRFEPVDAPAKPSGGDKPKPPAGGQPEADKPASGKVDMDKEEEGLKVVTAEGVGSTPDKALRKAFRSAVQQVVGAVVDEQTLSKNGELIEEKILTASNGFIKRYEEVSSKFDGDLHHVKIKAVVERRGVVEKLKEANIKVTSFEGANEFGRTVSILQARKDNTALLRKQLDALPEVLTAVEEAKPVYDDKDLCLVVNLSVRADPEAYAGYRQKFTDLLDKLQLRKWPAVVVPAEGKVHTQSPGKDELLFPKYPYSAVKSEEVKAFMNPFPITRGAAFWLCNRADVNTSRWTVYWVDCDPDETFDVLDGQLVVNIALLGKDGGIITEDEFPLDDAKSARLGTGWTLLRELKYRDKNGSAGNKGDGYSPYLYIAPMAFTFYSGFEYVPYLYYQRRIRLPVDNLKNIKELRYTIKQVHEPGKGPAKKRGRGK